MNRRNSIITLTSIFLLLFTVGSFLSGAKFLEYLIFDIIPIGNLLVPAALISISSLAIQIKQESKLIRIASIVSIIAALGWFPIGIILSGNIELNFVNDASDSATFELLTFTLVGIAVLVFLTSIGIRITSTIKRNHTPE